MQLWVECLSKQFRPCYSTNNHSLHWIRTILFEGDSRTQLCNLGCNRGSCSDAIKLWQVGVEPPSQMAACLAFLSAIRGYFRPFQATLGPVDGPPVSIHSMFFVLFRFVLFCCLLLLFISRALLHPRNHGGYGALLNSNTRDDPVRLSGQWQDFVAPSYFDVGRAPAQSCRDRQRYG